jgi:hypothetical protein
MSEESRHSDLQTDPSSPKAFAITDAELRLIAALVIIGLSSRPHIAYRIPAAIGISSVLRIQRSSRIDLHPTHRVDKR